MLFLLFPAPFPIRITGNLAGETVIKSIEVACKKQGAKFILFMGNSSNNTYVEALKNYLDENDPYLEPLIADAVKAIGTERSGKDPRSINELADAVTQWSLEESKKRVVAESDFLREEITAGRIGMATAFLHRSTRKINFSEIYSPHEIPVTNTL